MLEFRLNNRVFALDDSARVRMNWKNPACMVDSFPGDVGLGIEIPVNDHNRALLGNPERFEKYTQAGDREFAGFEIRFDGYLLMTGTLVVQGASKTYSGWLRSHLGDMGKTNKEKYINELAWKENLSFINKNIYEYPADEYCCPIIHNRAFWEGKGKMEKGKMNYRDEDGVWQEKDEEIEYLTKKFRDDNMFLVNTRDALAQVKSTEGSVVSPMLYLEYVVKEMLRLSGWFIGRNDWATDATMLQLFLYNNFNIMYPEMTTEEFVDLQWNQDGTDMVPYQVQLITSFAWEIGVVNYRDLIPRVKMKDFILGLQNLMNYIFHFRDDKRVNIIDRNAIPDRTPIDVNEWFVNEWEIGDPVSKQLKFVNEYDDNDGFQGDEWTDLSDRADDFGESVATITELQAIASPELGELRLVRAENKIYEWKWGVSTGETEYQDEPLQQDVLKWEFISTGPQPYLYGTGHSLEEVKTCFSTLAMYFDLPPFAAIPGALQHGNIVTMRSLWKDFSPRLLYNNNISAFFSEANITNSIVSLNWDGADGLFAKRWKNWAWMMKDLLPVEAQFNFPLNVIDYVKNNIYEPFRTSRGKFLIEEMEVEFGLNEIGVTTIKGYKI